jgi:hypothetical protein
MRLAVEEELHKRGILAKHIQVRGASIDDILCCRTEISIIEHKTLAQVIYFVNRQFPIPLDVEYAEADSLRIVGKRPRMIGERALPFPEKAFDAQVVYTGAVRGDLNRNQEHRKEVLTRFEQYLREHVPQYR